MPHWAIVHTDPYRLHWGPSLVPITCAASRIFVLQTLPGQIPVTHWGVGKDLRSGRTLKGDLVQWILNLLSRNKI